MKNKLFNWGIRSPSSSIDKPKQQPAQNEPNEVSTFRRILPQFLASSAKNMLILDFGLTLAIPSIVISALTGYSKDLNPNEYIHLTAEQASWLGSISFVGQPIGSLLSGLLSEPLGRKRSMFIVNVPHIIAWLMLYTATTKEVIFFAFGLLGLGIGLMEAPIITYLGEICEPSVRGILTACAGISATMGIFLVFLLGSFMAWRNVALVCAFVPAVTMIAISFVPETPIWLLSKERIDDALKSLQWLRGWVSPKAVEREFTDLQRYKDTSTACIECEMAKIKCTHPAPTLAEKLQDIFRKRTLKPFMIITLQFFIMQFCGIFAMRPFIVQILVAYGVPIGANATTVILGLLGVLANIILLIIVRPFGKRNIYLYSMVGTFLSCFALSVYAYQHLPSGTSSFNAEQTEANINSAEISYYPMALFLIMQFCTSIGVSSVPNMLISEMFPFKSRAFTSGLVAGINYVFAFFASKTYLDLERSLTMAGVIGFYGIFGVIGFITMYFWLPETEKRSLEDIEIHFSDPTKKWTDIHIRRNATSLKGHENPVEP